MTSNIVRKKPWVENSIPFLVRFARDVQIKVVSDNDDRQKPETIITAVNRETTDDS